MTEQNNKIITPRGTALLPFILFIVLVLGTGMVLSMQGVEQPFNQLKASVALFAAVIFAFIIYKGSIEEKS